MNWVMQPVEENEDFNPNEKKTNISKKDKEDSESSSSEDELDRKFTPVKNAIVSHQRNSHTMAPSIKSGPEFPERFSELNGSYLVDFPGMFDSKGDEIDVAVDLTL